MSKIRGVKPETWTDDKIVSVSPLARLLFIGMWNFSCDNGHSDNSPLQLKMRILPADNCDINELLQELIDAGLVEKMGEYLFIPTLSEHQKPHKKWWKTCDAPGCVHPGKASNPPDNSGPHVGNGGPTVGHGCSTADVDGDGDVEGDKNTSRQGTAVAVPRPDVQEVLDYLEASVVARGARPPSRGKAAQDAARLLIDRDGKTVEQIKAAIDFSANDEFWCSNILSMSKLRKQYDQLSLKAQQQRKKQAVNFDDIAAMGERMQAELEAQQWN